MGRERHGAARARLATSFACLALLALTAPPVARADEISAAPVPVRPWDFNGDGFADLAVGAPFEDLESPFEVENAGVVHVIYGSAGGLTSAGTQLLRQCSGFCRRGARIAGPGDELGRALASGDFNGDGFADLAIGVPGDPIGDPAQDEAGAVQIHFGSPSGLSSTIGQYLAQCGAFCGIGDRPEANDHAGWALAAGDFDADGRSDLAIGAPHEDVGTIEDAGLVSVLYGSPSGLITPSPEGTVAAVEVWTQNTSGVNDSAEHDDFFGRSLAAGNVGRGAPAELAIGVPLEDLRANPTDAEETLENAGAVNLLYGATTGGLSATGDQLWHERTGAIAKGSPTIAESFDLFGWSLAIANVGNGAQGDLAVGVPGEDIADASQTGAVDVFYGSDTGLTDAPAQWSEAPRRSGTQFGWSVAMANVGKTVEADLAVGQPRPVLQGDFPGTPIDPGSIAIIYGSASGLTSTGRQTWSQAGSIEGEPVNGELFGISLVAANFGQQAEADVAVGVQSDRVSTPSGTMKGGAVNVLYGTSTGVTAANDQLWTQESPGIPDTAEDFDLFGCLASCLPWSFIITG